MDEDRIMKQVIGSNMDFHPIIRDSKLCIDDKIYLQEALVEIFNNDFRALIDDMMKQAIEKEEYEIAALIRDELCKIDNK
jgi:siderophore synthetase component